MNRLKYGFILFGLSSFLLGCSTSTDPYNSGTLGALIGMNNGDWENQISTRQDNVDQKKMTRANIENENRRLSIEQDELSHIVEGERRKLSQLSLKLNDLTQELDDRGKDINKSRSKKVKIQQRIAQLSKEIKTIQLEIKNGKYNRQENQLKAKIKEIKDKIFDLHSMTLAID